MDGTVHLTCILLCGIINFIYSGLPVEGAAEFQLVGGTYEYEGAVAEVAENGSRVALTCDSLWGIEEATVICKSLNYTGADLALVAGYFGDPATPLAAYDEVMCTGMEEHLLQCNYTFVNWCANSGMSAGAICTTQGSLRLANSSTPGAGRVEILGYSGEWGTICDDEWDLTDAGIACRQLGYPHALEAIVNGDPPDTEPVFGPGSGPIFLDGLSCRGDERYLKDCWVTKGWGIHDCTHAEDAGVVCDTKLIRLSDGDYTNQGRVEVYYGGTWGTIAPTSSWDINAANVACRELGYTYGAVEAMFVYGGEARVLLDEVTCQGNESRIADCESLGWAKVQSRDPYPYHNKLTAGVTCIDPAEIVRLLSGSTSFEGVVEYRFNSEPGLICDPDWSENEANVTCRQLGYQYGRNETPVSLGPLSGTIFYRDYQCDGTESHLGECPYTSFRGCDSPSHIAQVRCGPPNEYDIRLQGSEYTEQGRVEIFLNNEWGSITDDYFSRSDESTVCRQLGYRSASYTFSDEVYFGRGSGNIVIDDLDCSSSDHKISDCSIRLTGSNSSNTHDDELEVLCYPFVSVANHPVRLINEKGEVNQDYGRVEIYHDGVWGAMCDYIYEADFLCRELGHADVTYARRLYLQQYDFPDADWIWFSFVSCNLFVDMDIQHLFQCRYTPWGNTGRCNYYDYLAGVQCIQTLPSLTTAAPGFNDGTAFPPYVVNDGMNTWEILLITVAIIMPAVCVVCLCYHRCKSKKRTAPPNNVTYTSNGNGIETVSMASPPPRYIPSSPSPVDLPPSYDSVVMSPSPVDSRDGSSEATSEDIRDGSSQATTEDHEDSREVSSQETAIDCDSEVVPSSAVDSRENPLEATAEDSREGSSETQTNDINGGVHSADTPDNDDNPSNQSGHADTGEPSVVSRSDDVPAGIVDDHPHMI